jgi:hypothetical protein
MDELIPSVRKVLVDLYSSLSSAKRIADDAGVKLSNVDLHGPMTDVWHSILQEASKVNRIDELMAVVQNEYADSQNWQVVYKSYQEFVQKWSHGASNNNELRLDISNEKFCQDKTSDLDVYGRLAETTFVIPTNEETFINWLRARAKREAGIGIMPSLKHYHYSHLDEEPTKGVAGGKNFGLRRDIFNRQNWNRVPLVCITIIPLSNRPDNAQCEVWVARLSQRDTINEQPAELSLWSLANSEYDRLVADILKRWTNSSVLIVDYRVDEWKAWGGRLPGEPPSNH